MYHVVAVRMWSLTSIDPDVQAEQAGLESASASTREERRTSSAMWKTKQYVSFWFRLDSKGRVQWSNWSFLAGHHFQTRWCSHRQRHHQVIKQRCCQVSFIKTDTWIVFETLGFFSHVWLVNVVPCGVVRWCPSDIIWKKWRWCHSCFPSSGFWTLFQLQPLVTSENQLRSWLKKEEQLTRSQLLWLTSLELQL